MSPEIKPRISLEEVDVQKFFIGATIIFTPEGSALQKLWLLSESLRESQNGQDRQISEARREEVRQEYSRLAQELGYNMGDGAVIRKDCQTMFREALKRQEKPR